MLLPLLLALSLPPGPVISNGAVVAVLENRRQPKPDGMDEVQPVATVRLQGQVVGLLVGALRIGSGSPDGRRWFEVRRDPVNGGPNGASDAGCTAAGSRRWRAGSRTPPLRLGSDLLQGRLQRQG